MELISQANSSSNMVKELQTRKHSTRMHTACSPTVHAWVASHQVSVPVRSPGDVTRGSSSEQVWKGFQSWPPDVTSRGTGTLTQGPCTQGVRLGLVPYTERGPVMRSNASRAMVSRDPLWTDKLTDAHDWKLYLATTWLVGGNNSVRCVKKCLIIGSFITI